MRAKLGELRQDGSSVREVAALYVDTRRGPYPDMDGVDCWDEARDARLYDGPHPVVAHPPCKRWGQYADGGPSAKVKRKVGDDGGCFAAAIEAVRKWGGVLEHPRASKAWRAFGLLHPPRRGGWIVADEHGWTCCIEQGHYGHPARKATWLYAVGCPLPSLRWGEAPEPPGGWAIIDGSTRNLARRRQAGLPDPKRLTEHERHLTPPPFAAILMEMARGARV